MDGGKEENRRERRGKAKILGQVLTMQPWLHWNPPRVPGQPKTHARPPDQKH